MFFTSPLSYANPRTDLVQAVTDGNLTEVRILLDQGALIDITGQNNALLFIKAAEKGHREILEILLEKGVDVNIQLNGATALITASIEGHIGVVNDLLQKGADVNILAFGKTAIFYALESRRIDVVKVFLEHDVDINIKNQSGRTILMNAAKQGYFEIVRILIEKGANVNVKGSGGATALILAAAKGHSDVVKILLENNADVNIYRTKRISSLFFAAQNGHSKTVQFLLDANFDNEDKNKALNVASFKGRHDIVKILLKNGAQYVPTSGFFLVDSYADVVDVIVEEQFVDQDQNGLWDAINIHFFFDILSNGSFHIITEIQNKDGKILDYIDKRFYVTNAPSQQKVTLQIPNKLLYRNKGFESLVISDINIFESNKIIFVGSFPDYFIDNYSLEDFQPPPSPKLGWCLPSIGKHSGGYKVLLKGGRYLIDVTEVYFGTQKSPSFVMVDDETLSVVVPPWNGVNAKISIRVVSPWDETSRREIFHYYDINYDPYEVSIQESKTIKNGKYKNYYSNGKIKEEGEIKNFKFIWKKRYDKQGRLIEK